MDAPEDEVESRLLLDVVVRKSAAVLELLAGEDKALLVGRDTERRNGAKGQSRVGPMSVVARTPPCPGSWP
jgi:hypothetical protein